MNADDPAVAIRNAIRDRLQRLAGELGDLAELSRVGDDDTGEVVWHLQPAYPDAAPVTWDESRTDDWAASLTLGTATEVRVLTCPDRSAGVAPDTVAAHITPVISGDFREELWRSRRMGQPIAAVGWIRDHDGGSWRLSGTAHARYRSSANCSTTTTCVTTPATTRRCGNACWPRSTTVAAPPSTPTRPNEPAAGRRHPEGARLAAKYLDIDLASASEPQLRARIEAAIRT